MKNTIEISRELAENLLHCGDTASTITPFVTAQLRALIAGTAIDRKQDQDPERLLMVSVLSAEDCEPIAKHVSRHDVRLDPSKRYRITISGL